MNKPIFDRRGFLKFGAVAAGTMALAEAAPVAKKALQKSERLYVKDATDKINPIDRDIKPQNGVYSGDNPKQSHSILWGKADYIKDHGWPGVTEDAPLVIVGGGISGLFAGYLLRDHKPIILEQAERFGGNSRGESWQGIDYSLGAAYFMEQEDGSEIKKLFTELGVYDKSHSQGDADEPIGFQNKVIKDFWNGETDPARKADFRKVKKYFEDTFQSQNGLQFPDFPGTSDKMMKYVRSLDRENFIQRVEKDLKGPLHPHIRTLIEHYCWSTFGASATEVSAAAGLNSYSAEFGTGHAVPGGNAGIAEMAVNKILQTVPVSHLRAQSMVYDVRQETGSESMIVTYLNADGERRSIRAKAVIMACPKFVVDRLIDDLEPQRQQAIQKLKYRAYMVANVLVNEKPPENFYDLYLIANGKLESTVPDSARKHRVSDIVLANYTSPNPNQTVLTMYRGFPYGGVRHVLLAPDSYQKFKQEFEDQIRTEVFPMLGMNTSHIQEVRLTRWGHPLPIPAVGLINDGTIDQLRAPYRNSVFFVEQDNWMFPAIEVCALEALAMQSSVRARLQKA